MAIPNRFENLKQRLTSDSASWGSLLILVLSIAMLVLFMMLFSQGWLMQPSLTA